MGGGGAEFINQHTWTNNMEPFFKIVIWPVWTAFAWSMELLGQDVPAAMKFDAIVSRSAHALNRPQKELDGNWPLFEPVVSSHGEPPASVPQV